MRRWGLAFLLIVFTAQLARADDTGLKSLSAKLTAIRGTHPATNQYEAGPELTPIKHQMRFWVESQLRALGAHGDADHFAKELNQNLSAAGLICDDAHKKECDDGSVEDFNRRGFIDDVRVSYLDSRYLLVETNVGILCGYDESAYVYAWHDGRWQILLETEQNDYRKTHYVPQNLFSVTVSPANAKQPPLILTLGYSPWCQSAWQKLFVRLRRVSPSDPTPRPLFDMMDTTYLSDEAPRVRLSDNDAMFTFDGSSIDGDVLVRSHVWHLSVHDRSFERIEPVALDPRSFVDEWLTRPRNESDGWADASAHLPALHRWYARFHEGGGIFGNFDDEPLRCRGDRTLWQVGFTKQAGPKNPELTGYFLVRSMAPYRFTLMDIRKEKSRDCDIADPMRDNVGTLFPFH